MNNLVEAVVPRDIGYSRRSNFILRNPLPPVKRSQQDRCRHADAADVGRGGRSWSGSRALPRGRWARRADAPERSLRPCVLQEELLGVGVHVLVRYGPRTRLQRLDQVSGHDARTSAWQADDGILLLIESRRRPKIVWVYMPLRHRSAKFGESRASLGTR